MSLKKTMNKSNSGNSIKKRAKELDCLYAFSSLIVKNNITVDEILQGTIDLIPPSSQYPAITSARIILEDQIYKTKNFKESIWKQTSDIVVHGKHKGTLEICYLEQISKPFPKEEKELINVIAERLGRIIERKKTEEALRKSEKRFRDLVENSLTGIFILQDSEIVYNNPEQKRHFSRLSRSFKLMDFKGIHPDDVEMVKQNYQKIVSGEVSTLDISFRFYPLEKSDNKLDRKWVCCRISLIEYSGKEAILFNMMDVTRSKEMERLLKIKDKMTSLGRVTAGIAHEIRNPLSGINIYLNTLEKIYDKTDSPEKVKTIIRQLKSASNKIESVIKRVMDFSKPGEPRLMLSKINHPVEEAINLSSVTFQKSGIKIEKFLSQNLPHCHIDQHFIEQAILNLMTNAAEAMKNMDGNKRIIIKTYMEDNRIFISVADSGTGVPSSLKDRIFDPFFTTKSDSSGIGLSICHRIITDHGGSLGVLDSKWGGAEFKIELPLERRTKQR